MRQAELFPGLVTGGVFDDFFRPAARDARLPLERMREIADRLHRAVKPMKLWIVYYSALFEVDYSAYLREADVITFWSWTSEELKLEEARLEKIIQMTPEKEHFAGCYLWNYGDQRELTVEEMAFQLDVCYRMMKSGKLDGVVVCGNNVADLGFPAVEYFRKWFAAHRDEEF